MGVIQGGFNSPQCAPLKTFEKLEPKIDLSEATSRLPSYAVTSRA